MSPSNSSFRSAAPSLRRLPWASVRRLRRYRGLLRLLRTPLPRSGLPRPGVPGATGSFFAQNAVPVANRALPGGLIRGSALASPALVPRKPADLPSSRASPVNACPALRPRRPDSSTVPRSHRCCLPGAENRRRPRLYKFRGSITRPASSLLLASHPASRRRTRESLPTCGRALAGWDSHPLGDNDEFPIGASSSLPDVSGFAWRTQRLAGRRGLLCAPPIGRGRR
jgi:hypothetical protein